jgi:hypothetical protein
MSSFLSAQQRQLIQAGTSILPKMAIKCENLAQTVNLTHKIHLLQLFRKAILGWFTAVKSTGGVSALEDRENGGLQAGELFTRTRFKRQ